jgi:prepilin-type N-terminal cleavage/methylation domain-containing protein
MLQRLRNRIATGEREGGFTLIELLVVLIIIAVLLAIAIPSYLGFRARAEQRTAQSNVRAAIPAAEAYYQDDIADGGGGGSYVGMDFDALKAIDSGLAPGLVVDAASLSDTSYCLEFTKGSKVASYTGPGGEVVTTGC